MDPAKIRKVLRIYRAAKMVGRVGGEYEKMTSFLSDHSAQSSRLLRGKDLAVRVLEQKVRPEDVRDGGRAVVNSIPNVYRAVHRHMQKQKKNAKA